MLDLANVFNTKPLNCEGVHPSFITQGAAYTSTSFLHFAKTLSLNKGYFQKFIQQQEPTANFYKSCFLKANTFREIDVQKPSGHREAWQ